MEKFESFRQKTAEEIKEAPKKVRKAYLEAKKEEPEFKEAKELHRAKKDIYELSHTEELKDVENPAAVSEWIEKELNDFVDRREGFLMGSHFRDLFSEVVKYLARKKGLELNDLGKHPFVGDYQSENTYNEFDEGKTSGSVYFGGNKIFDYSSHDDGYGFTIQKWYGDNLDVAVSNYLKLLDSIKARK